MQNSSDPAAADAAAAADAQSKPSMFSGLSSYLTVPSWLSFGSKPATTAAAAGGRRHRTYRKKSKSKRRRAGRKSTRR